MPILCNNRANKEQTLRLCTSLSSTGSARSPKGYQYYNIILPLLSPLKEKVVTESDYEDVIPVPPTGFNQDSNTLCLGRRVEKCKGRKRMTLAQGTKRIVHNVPAFAFAGDIDGVHAPSFPCSRLDTNHTHASPNTDTSIAINTLIGFPFFGMLPFTYSHDHTFMRAINLGSSYSVNQKSSPPLDAVDSESRDE